MPRWSLNHAQEIFNNLADFIYKRFTNSIYVTIKEDDLYHAVINLNKYDNNAIIAVIKSNSGKNYLLIKCTKERYIDVSNKIKAMYDHHNDILNAIRQ